MALDLNRWFKYAKARIDSAVGQGNETLDRLEAEREVELADKPWLRSEGDIPTFDEARARIEWEAEHQNRQADAAPPPPPSPSGGADLTDEAAAAEMAEAARELKAREQASAERLDAIRKELGVDASAAPPEPPTTRD